MGETAPQKIGWIGTGRMGLEMATRLAQAGCDLAVWNRTASKAKPLTELGAKVVPAARDLAPRDVVFTMVSGPEDFEQVTVGPAGVLSDPDATPRVLVDSSTVSKEASDRVRRMAAERGTALLAAPVSGNPKVVRAGRLTLVVSGPRKAFEQVRNVLEQLGAGVVYVGEGDRARLVKICHNLMLGAVAQCMAETTVLAEAGGVGRREYLEFLNGSVLGSAFTRYKTPALLSLDFAPTFTPPLLCKDLDLGLEAANELGVRLPLVERVRNLVQEMIDQGYVDCDFAALLEVEAKAAGLTLEPERGAVDDGLSTITEGGLSTTPEGGRSTIPEGGLSTTP